MARARRWLIVLAVVATLITGEPGRSEPAAAAGTTCTVSSAADSGANTLRVAITGANGPGGCSTINFNIPGGGAHAITLASYLPAMAAAVTVDGTSQPGYSGTPLIVIDGHLLPAVGVGAGLEIDASGGGTTIKGLAINGFTNASGILISGSSNNTIQADFIGTDAAGTASVPNLVGVKVQDALQQNGTDANATNNTIGGTSAGARNLISGNVRENILVHGSLSALPDGTTIAGNIIGPNLAGSVSLTPSGGRGVELFGATNTVVGGTSPGARNVISGNAGEGISTFGSSTNTTVSGNLIGTDSTGARGLGNGTAISLNDGGGDVVTNNVIAANGAGIAAVRGNGDTITGNLIGLNAAGSAALGNGGAGLGISGSTNDTIGGATAATRNVIAGNTGDGILLSGAGGGTIQGNYIGTDAGGTVALGNGGQGVDVANTTGGTVVGNVIAANALGGVFLNNAGGIAVRNNLIGTDASGTMPLGNSQEGVASQSGTGNTITGNVIAATTRPTGTTFGDGIHISSGNATITRNLIGTDAQGANLSNAGDGIALAGNGGSTAGGTGAGNGNLIAFNGGNGVTVLDGTDAGNAIRGNSIHDNGKLGIDLGGDGVTLNSPGGPHTGRPNDFQNYPVLTGVSVSGTQITIGGSLNGSANTTFHLDFYDSPSCNPSGHGEGQTYLGSSDQTTAGNDVSFSITVTTASPISAGHQITATATDPSGNTSEFSSCARVPGVAPSATFTETATSTRTSTATATATPTGTITTTPSRTGTATSTGTVTQTGTRTGTATHTGTSSATPTPTTTSTPTATSSNTPTATPTLPTGQALQPWGWGLNTYGQVGDGTRTEHDTPMPVSGLPDVSAIAAGVYYSLAIRADHTVWAWGDNSFGQLGNGTKGISILAPRQVVTSAGPLTGITAIAGGYRQSLALDGSGHAWAWGWNNAGQLGDGTATERDMPVPVLVVSGGVAIAAGLFHSLALDAQGHVWSWGGGASGQLGSGMTGNRPKPGLVPGLKRVMSIAAGSYHGLALDQSGRVWAWGDNAKGQLGTGTSGGFSTVPVPVIGLPLITAIAAGGSDSYALDGNGNVWAWGYGGEGALGNGAYGDSARPVRVPHLGVVTAIAAGGFTVGTGFTFGFESHVLALAKDDTLWGWGDNSDGELGNGANGTTSNVPVLVRGLTHVSAIAAGAYHSLALSSMTAPPTPTDTETSTATATPTSTSSLSDGQPVSWGENDSGQLGDGSPTDRSAPVQVNPRNVSAIAAGVQHSLALRNDGAVWAWGDNSMGQLGNVPAGSGSRVPVRVNTLTGALTGMRAIAAGAQHSLALDANGVVWWWGESTPNAGYHPFAAAMFGMHAVTAIAAGDHFSLALDGSGNVWAWGDNSHGQLGDGTNNPRDTPVQVRNLGCVTAIAAGSQHGLALDCNGNVWAWGSNQFGQLGVGVTDLYTPLRVRQLGAAGTIAAGSDDSMALLRDGTVWEWGNESPGTVLPPHQVPNLSGVTAIAAGGTHGLALLGDGTVRAWGSNLDGELGDGGAEGQSATPVVVSRLSGITAIAANSDPIAGGFSLAIHGSAPLLPPPPPSHGVWSWGGQSSWVPSQLANFPPDVSPLPPLTVLQVASGINFQLALLSDHSLWAWGDDSFGQLGDAGVYCEQHRTCVSGPLQVPLLPNTVVAIAAADVFGMALLGDGSVWAWGSSYDGVLGCNCPGSPRMIIPGSTHIVRIAAGGGDIGQDQLLTSGPPWMAVPQTAGDHALALDASGHVLAWGDNTQGQLGNGQFCSISISTNPNDPLTSCWSTTPVDVQDWSLRPIDHVIAIAAGERHSLAVKANGDVWAWGADDRGQLGGPIGVPVFPWAQPVLGLPCSLSVCPSTVPKAVAVAGGGAHSLALLSDGTVWAWGANDRGQLGLGDIQDRLQPTRVGVRDAIAIAAGSNHSLAATFHGPVYAWGDNGNCQLGTNPSCNPNLDTPPVVPFPRVVIGITDMAGIAASADSSMAFK